MSTLGVTGEAGHASPMTCIDSGPRTRRDWLWDQWAHREVLLLPALAVPYGLHTLLLIPAILLAVAFATALSMVLAALHVYFRDVRYLVQAGLLVLFYLTPIAYPQRIVGSLGPWMDFNPLTG